MLELYQPPRLLVLNHVHKQPLQLHESAPVCLRHLDRRQQVRNLCQQPEHRQRCILKRYPWWHVLPIVLRSV
jgi:hypothetical protein